MSSEDDIWNASDRSFDSFVDDTSSTLPQQPPVLDTNLQSLPLAHLQFPLDFDRESSGPHTSSNTQVVSSPPKPLVMSAPVLIPQKNGSMPSMQPLTKTAPANPHTTKEDVESQHLSSSYSSSVNENLTDHSNQSQLVENLARSASPQQQQQQGQQQSPSTPTQPTANFFNNMFTAATSSLQFNRTRATDHTTVEVDAVDASRSCGDSSATVDEKNVTSPSMMSYRRSKGKGKRRNTSLSSVDLPESPLLEVNKPYTPAESFDMNLYVDEKYKGTSYRYATVTRNEDFHKLFMSVPKTERLLDDFSCALSRDILLQGRMYVSEHNICFNSNLLGWVTNLVIPFSNIEGFQKTVTAGLFHNGISISSKDGVKSFASFMSRDVVYQFLHDVWKASGDQFDTEGSDKRVNFMSLSAPMIVNKEMQMGQDAELNAAIMSIDGDSPMKRRASISTSLESASFASSDEEDEEESDSVGSWKETKITTQSVYNLKNTSKYTYSGPHAHARTKSDYDPEENKEYILARENLKCPPGVLYELLFGENTEMIVEYLTSQDSRDFSEFSKYELNDDDKQERHYEYIKGLSFAMGPKQTKCLVKETVEHHDPQGYINVVNTTQTPDVPSGGSFCVKTRYIMTWGANNTTDMLVSYWVHWMGSSWVKGVVEKSTKSGQEAATKALLEIIKKTLAENVEESAESVALADTPQEDIVLENETELITHTKQVSVVTPQITMGSFTPFNFIVVTLLSVIVLLQIWTIQSIGGTPQQIASTGTYSVLESLPSVGNLHDTLFRGDEVLVWSWIDERAGKIDTSKTEKAKAIQEDIDVLLTRWNNGDLNTNEGRAIVSNVERAINEYAKLTEEDMKKQARADDLRRAINALL